MAKKFKEVDYEPTAKSGKGKLIVIIIGLLVIAVVGVAGAFLFLNSGGNNVIQSDNSKQLQQAKQDGDKSNTVANTSDLFKVDREETIKVEDIAKQGDPEIKASKDEDDFYKEKKLKDGYNNIEVSKQVVAFQENLISTAEYILQYLPDDRLEKLGDSNLVSIEEGLRQLKTDYSKFKNIFKDPQDNYNMYMQVLYLSKTYDYLAEAQSEQLYQINPDQAKVYKNKYMSISFLQKALENTQKLSPSLVEIYSQGTEIPNEHQRYFKRVSDVKDNQSLNNTKASIQDKF